MTPGLLCPGCVSSAAKGAPWLGMEQPTEGGAGPFPAHLCPQLLFLWSLRCSACKAWGFLLSPRYQRPLKSCCFHSLYHLILPPCCLQGLHSSGVTSSGPDCPSQAHVSEAA